MQSRASGGIHFLKLPLVHYGGYGKAEMLRFFKEKGQTFRLGMPFLSQI
jgi:hypothetical protein